MMISTLSCSPHLFNDKTSMHYTIYHHHQYMWKCVSACCARNRLEPKIECQTHKLMKAYSLQQHHRKLIEMISMNIGHSAYCLRVLYLYNFLHRKICFFFLFCFYSFPFVKGKQQSTTQAS